MECLFYWGGIEIPKWRQELIKNFSLLHPEFHVDYIYDSTCTNGWEHSNSLRFEFVSGGKNRLWIDSDIELYKRLPLGNNSGVSYEGTSNYSILWSGDNPEAFANINLKCDEFFSRVDRMYNRGQMDYFSSGRLYRHWLSGVPRDEIILRFN